MQESGAEQTNESESGSESEYEPSDSPVSAVEDDDDDSAWSGSDSVAPPSRRRSRQSTPRCSPRRPGAMRPSTSLTRFASTGQTLTDAAHPHGIASSQRSNSAGQAADAAASTASLPIPAPSPSPSPSSQRRHVCDHPGCGRTFIKVGKLNRHKVIHTGVRPFVCSYPGCGRSFTRNDRMRRHWKIHQNEELEERGTTHTTKDTLNIASNASKQQGKRGTASRRWKKVDEEKSKESTEQSEDEMQRIRHRLAAEHQDLMSGSDIEPIIPSATLNGTGVTSPTLASSSSSAVRLTSLPSLPPNLPPLVKFACPLPGCNLSFLLREHLKRHVNAVHPDHNMPDDKRATVKASEKQEENKAGESSSIDAHPTVSASSAPSECQTVSAPSPAAVAAPSTTTTTSAAHKRRYACSHVGCLLSFDKAHKLREHAYVHTGIMPWICNFPIHSNKMPESEIDEGNSEDESEQEEAATNPAQGFHTMHSSAPSSSSYSSMRCNEGFLTRTLLLKHQRLCHTADRHVCGELDCGATFNRFQDLVKHRRIHKAAALTCPHCGHQSSHGSNHRKHLQTHLSPEERKATLRSCPFDGCGKAFTTPSNLNQHIRAQHDANWKGLIKEGLAKRSSRKKIEPVVERQQAENEDQSHAAGQQNTTVQPDPTPATSNNAVSEHGVDAVASPASSCTSSPANPNSDVVRRFACPFTECIPRMTTAAYAQKQSLHRHLHRYHSIPLLHVDDAIFIQQAVTEADERTAREGPPVRLHPNSARRASTLTKLAGATKPYRKSTRKRQREEEQAQEGIVENDSSTPSPALSNSAQSVHPLPSVPSSPSPSSPSPSSGSNDHDHDLQGEKSASDDAYCDVAMEASMAKDGVHSALMPLPHTTEESETENKRRKLDGDADGERHVRTANDSADIDASPPEPTVMHPTSLVAQQAACC